MPSRFVLFGPDHLAAVGLTALTAAGLARMVRGRAHGRLGWSLRVALVVALLAATAATLWASSRRAPLTLWDVLPLQLCDLLIPVSAFALLTRRQTAYELLYFWGCAGTLLALVGPDVHTGFPDWRFLSFFALHGLVVVAAVVLTFGYGMRPRPGAPWRVFLITNAYAALAGVLNVAFGRNLLFLRHKPAAATLLDWMGPWPVYIVIADVFALGLFWLLNWPLSTAQNAGRAGSAELRWDPPTEGPADAGPVSLADTFVRLACLDYGDWHPSSAAKARRLLAEHPDLARADIYAAATVGDVAATRAMLAKDPSVANAKGGPLGWEPLLYASYSRLNSADPQHSTLEVARLLLASGADPNAGFLWRGLVPPFTALTGAFGEGEDGKNQGPHQHWRALARLLLDAGADPNDGQTLYNRHFNRSDEHLELLFAYGLGQDKGGPWFKRLGDTLQSPERLLVEELWSAARKNFPERVELLVDRGADVNTPGLRDGRTPYEAAVRAGNHEIAEYLLQHGARKVELDPAEAFAAACIAGRRAEAAALLEADPKLVETLGHHGRVELLHRAVEGNRPEGIRLMAGLGFELHDTTRHDGVGMNLAATPMHNAAWAGNLEMVKLLVALGADPTVREPSYDATPLGWAAHNQQRHVVEYLAAFATIFDALECGAVERVAALLEADRSLASAVDDRGAPLVFRLHARMTNVDAAIDLLLAHGVDLNARNREGRTLLDEIERRGSHDLASTLRGRGARTAAELSSSG
ncbi:MAG: TIGR02206 family membrane protein [Solirubrobacterales bacterium]